MFISTVVGHVVCTQKNETLGGYKLLLIAPEGKVEEYNSAIHAEQNLAKASKSDMCFVAIDTVCAGIGDKVLVSMEDAARYATDTMENVVDMAIVGIVDTVDLQ